MGGQGKTTELMIEGDNRELKAIAERLRIGVMNVNLEVYAPDHASIPFADDGLTSVRGQVGRWDKGCGVEPSRF